MRARTGGCVSGSALLLALALLAPSPAAAQETPNFSEDCREQTESEALCRGGEKLAERASAECRRAGSGSLPDERCYGPMGRRVNRAAVAAYRSSWTHRALQFQYALAAEVPFRDAPWIGTHNSFNSPSELPTLSHTDSNQQLSLTEQLDIDMRSLELDVHWFPSPRAGAEAADNTGRAPVVCHARGSGEGHAGCTTERPLSQVLADIAAWLNATENRDQVLLLYVEDHFDDEHGYEYAGEVLENGLERPAAEGGASLIFHPDRGDDQCADLPLDLTRKEVLDAGAQVVLVSSCGPWGGTVFDWDPVEKESRPQGFDPESCGPDFERSDYDSLLIRYFEDSTWVAAGAERSGLSSTDDGITPDTAAAMSRCGVDLLSMDQILPDDGRLEKLVWSWAPGQPDDAGGDCAAQLEGSRWAMRDCAERRPAACRQADGGWTLTRAGRYRQAEARCRAQGGRFDQPRTGFENARLAEASGGSGAWIRVGGA